MIEGRICGERWHLIHFEEVRSEVLVQHDVEAQELKTNLVHQVVGLARAVQVVHVRLRNAHRFDYDVVDLLFTLINDFLSMNITEHLHHSGIAALAAHVVFVLVLVLDVVGGFLVDRIVGQVHEEVVKVGRGWGFVLFGRKTGQAILVDVDAHRCDSVY